MGTNSALLMLNSSTNSFCVLCRDTIRRKKKRQETEKMKNKRKERKESYEER